MLWYSTVIAMGLVAGLDRSVDGASAIAKRAGLIPIGLTIVSMGPPHPRS